MSTQSQIIETLEKLIDAHGLYEVSACLELLCYEKAEHLRTNWQDIPAAKRWERAAKVFYAAHHKLEKIQNRI